MQGGRIRKLLEDKVSIATSQKENMVHRNRESKLLDSMYRHNA